MDALWARSVRAVHEALADRGLAYTTVMTVLSRLADKGFVLRERDGRAWLYAPAASRDQYVAELMFEALGETGDRNGALTPRSPASSCGVRSGSPGSGPGTVICSHCSRSHRRHRFGEVPSARRGRRTTRRPRRGSGHDVSDRAAPPSADHRSARITVAVLTLLATPLSLLLAPF
jgi:hypothetical protein